MEQKGGREDNASSRGRSISIGKSDRRMAKASLRGMNISSLKEFMDDIVGKGPATLDLSANALTALPDLSALKSLTELDIRSNPFPSVSSVLPALKSIPNLKSLHIDAKSDAEEYAIVYALPLLEFLNGVSLGDDASSPQGQPAPGLVQAKPQELAPAPEEAPSIKEISLGKFHSENLNEIYSGNLLLIYKLHS